MALMLTDFDFDEGIVPGVKWPSLRDRALPAVVKIQEWIDAGELCCPTSETPDPVMDLLFRTKPSQQARKPVATSGPVVNSWPYKCGQDQGKADRATGRETPCTVTGVTRLQWLDGYYNEPEKPEHEYRQQWANDQADAVAEETKGRRLATDGRGLDTDQTGTSTELMGAAATIESGEGQASSEPMVLDPAASTAAMGLEEPKSPYQAGAIAGAADREATRRGRPQDTSCGLPLGPDRDRWVDGYYGRPERTDAEYSQMSAWLEDADTDEVLATLEEDELDEDEDESQTLFGDDEMGTATAKRPVKSKAAGKAKPKAGKTAATAEKAKPAKAKAKVDESLFRIESEIQDWDVDAITKSPYDAREEESDKSPELMALVESIKKRGVINPLLIRPNNEHIAGWRRRRAAKLAGLKTVPVRLVHCDDLTAGDLVLEENEKRKALTEREQCIAYNARLQQYIEAGKTQKQLAAALSIDHSTLSNKLRLKSLSHDSWVLFEEGWLTLDHIRGLATHAMVPGFEEAFLGYAETQQKDSAKPLAEFAIKNAMAAGFQKAYRRVDTLGAKVTDAQRKELGVTTIEDPQLGKIEVTTNVAKFDELKAAAAEKAAKRQERNEKQYEAEGEAIKPKTPKVKAPEKASKEREQEQLNQEIKLSWCMAFAAAIRDRFVKVKAKDVDQLMRLGMLVQQSATKSELMSLDQLLNDQKEFEALVQMSVLNFFDTKDEVSNFESNWFELSLAELEQIAKWLGVNSLPFFAPTASLIARLSDEDAIALRDECELEPGVTDTDRKELNQRILAVWEPPCNWCPERFNYANLPAPVPF